jgi:hypothetical protein
MCTIVKIVIATCTYACILGRALDGDWCERLLVTSNEFDTPTIHHAAMPGKAR